MPALLDILRDMRRPPTLVKAARIAAIGGKPARKSQAALLAEEEALNHARLSGHAGYAPSAHVTVLAQLLIAARGAEPARPRLSVVAEMGLRKAG